jgi:AraC-like DNA-binding protein
MPTNETTSATTLRLFVDALTDLGVDVATILRKSGVDAASLKDPEARISRDSFDRVWVVASEVTGDPCIGLHAGARVHPRAVNLFGYLVLSSATLGEGLERVVRFQRVLMGAPVLALDASEVPARLRIGMQDGDPETRAVCSEYVAPLVLGALRFVSESNVAPLKARFQHAARGDPSDYERLLGCPVEFLAERSELLLSKETLERESRHASPSLAGLHEQFARRMLALREDCGVVGRVRRELAGSLEGGSPTLGVVARRLAMSQRSLQRRLAEEGTRFGLVLEDLRRELAREHLEAHGAAISEIAWLTGFSDVSAFTRAVSRWFGRGPAQLRREFASRVASVVVPPARGTETDGISRSAAGGEAPRALRPTAPERTP